ncbi:hypothetical protein [Streptomyces sp. NPDC014995]|uniref:hypothetical protein n=1 Tax=Streptomyces sp. NPDC014995 TaxID=3364936 RepID=UPI0036FF158F
MTTTALVHRTDRDPLTWVRDWAAAPALRELVEMFDGEWPARGSLRERLASLEAFSDVWDRRRGGSRLAIAEDDGTLPGDRILALAEELGMVEPAPVTGGHFDRVLILGGLSTGCRSRAEYAAGLLGRGAFSADEVCFMGSFRTLLEGEHADAREFAPDATTEVGMLRALADVEFPSADPWSITVDGDPGTAPRLAELRGERPGKPGVRLYAARSSDPARNANTADTYRQFARDVRLDAARVLLVTTHIYAPYQHMDAVRVLGLPFHSEVETIGTPPQLSRRVFDAPWYLQELRSTIRAAHALVVACEAEE